MLKENSESSKNLIVTVGKNVLPIPSYELVLVRGTSDYLEIQLAKKTETDAELKVFVDSIFRIPQNAVPHFARQFSKYLQEFVDKTDAP